MLKIPKILTKKPYSDFWELIILITDLMPDFCDFNFRANAYFIFEIRQVDLRKFHFHEIAEKLLRKNYYCDNSSKWRHH